ncbi:MAG TPA: hypothetical protein VJC07_02150 [Candidatus Nanoarchaeia archaeon]|nr:hypothetical protein [Candidatus Nanoarchaeia archaeon]
MASKNNKGKNENEQRGEESTSTALVSNLYLPNELVEQLQQSESLAEILPEDRLIAHECFNVKLKDKEGNWIPANCFFNTVTEEVSEEIDAVLLFLKKSRRYVTWDEEAGSTLMCFSLDLTTGNWQEDPFDTRVCETCPLQKWGNGRNGTPPPCKVVWNFVGINLKTRDPFVISAKSTSLKPMKQFVNQYFIGKMKGKNLPLFCYAVKLRLTQPIGTYAVLQPEIGHVFGKEDIEVWHQLAQELWNSQRVDLMQIPPEEIEVQKVSESQGEDLPF